MCADQHQSLGRLDGSLLFKLSILGLVPVFFGLLFGLAFLQCWFNVSEEWRGRKARKFRGLPKPWWEADDDRAYEWFLKYPDTRIQMTLENRTDRGLRP